MSDKTSESAHAALIARRDELKAIEAAGRTAEAERKALDAEIEKADAPQPDPYTAETLRMIEQHHLNEADADAFIRARKMAQFPALVAEQRDRKLRAARRKSEPLTDEQEIAKELGDGEA
jgi:hypothetical protein